MNMKIEIGIVNCDLRDVTYSFQENKLLAYNYVT